MEDTIINAKNKDKILFFIIAPFCRNGDYVL